RDLVPVAFVLAHRLVFALVAGLAVDPAFAAGQSESAASTNVGFQLRMRRQGAGLGRAYSYLLGHSSFLRLAALFEVGGLKDRSHANRLSAFMCCYVRRARCRRPSASKSGANQLVRTCHPAARCPNRANPTLEQFEQPGLSELRVLALDDLVDLFAPLGM